MLLHDRRLCELIRRFCHLMSHPSDVYNTALKAAFLPYVPMALTPPTCSRYVVNLEQRPLATDQMSTRYDASFFSPGLGFLRPRSRTRALAVFSNRAIPRVSCIAADGWLLSSCSAGPTCSQPPSRRRPMSSAISGSRCASLPHCH